MVNNFVNAKRPCLLHRQVPWFLILNKRNIPYRGNPKTLSIILEEENQRLRNVS